MSGGVNGSANGAGESLDDVVNLDDVFKTSGYPRVTYVVRKGSIDRRLREAFLDSGKLILLTGPSKTGKSTLRENLVRKLKADDLCARCYGQLDLEQIWRTALEKASFERVVTTQEEVSHGSTLEGKAKGNSLISWLLGVELEAGGKIERGRKVSLVKERVLADPSAVNVAGLIRATGGVLSIEDFHKLTLARRVDLFEQLKTLCDLEASALVLCASHRIADIPPSCVDLVGRIKSIPVEEWSQGDLKEIAVRGLRHLQIRGVKEPVDLIASEAAGLPIIVQAAFKTLLRDAGVEEVARGYRNLRLGRVESFRALHKVCNEDYSPLFREKHRQLQVFLREEDLDRRSYLTAVLLFGLAGVGHSLREEELDARVEELRVVDHRLPTPGEFREHLPDLEKVDAEFNLGIVDWHEKTRRLYFLEPSFLFFLRWRVRRTDRPFLSDYVRELALG